MTTRADYDLLTAVLAGDDLSDEAREAFEGMLERLGDYPLTPKQRAWAEAAVEGRRYEAPPEYQNLFSAGLVPRGKEVELLVRDKPLKPPTRK